MPEEEFEHDGCRRKIVDERFVKDSGDQRRIA